MLCGAYIPTNHLSHVIIRPFTLCHLVPFQ